jgi:holdfast attachment protein HfaA
MAPIQPRSTGAFSLGLLLLAALPGVCASQTMNASAATYNAGYNRTAGSENAPVNVAMTDNNGNMVVVGGLIQNGATGSVFNNSGANAATFAYAGGVGSGSSGVSGGGAATAVGNNLSVVVQGSDNVVVVNSTQTNTGAVTATTTTKGN